MLLLRIIITFVHGYYTSKSNKLYSIYVNLLKYIHFYDYYIIIIYDICNNLTIDFLPHLSSTTPVYNTMNMFFVISTLVGRYLCSL